jgi:hypothetical protein
MLTQTELSHLLYIRNIKNEHGNKPVCSRTMNKAIRASIIQNLEQGQKIYRINPAKLEIVESTFVGFFKWNDSDGESRVTAHVSHHANCRHTTEDQFLIRNLMENEGDTSAAYLDKDVADRVLRRFQRNAIKDLTAKLEALENPPTEVTV